MVWLDRVRCRRGGRTCAPRRRSGGAKGRLGRWTVSGGAASLAPPSRYSYTGLHNYSTRW
eukprot:1183189-Prorocentrum_minimum.AAC.1